MPKEVTAFLLVRPDIDSFTTRSLHHLWPAIILSAFANKHISWSSISEIWSIASEVLSSRPKHRLYAQYFTNKGFILCSSEHSSMFLRSISRDVTPIRHRISKSTWRALGALEFSPFCDRTSVSTMSTIGSPRVARRLLLLSLCRRHFDERFAPLIAPKARRGGWVDALAR